MLLRNESAENISYLCQPADGGRIGLVPRSDGGVCSYAESDVVQVYFGEKFLVGDARTSTPYRDNFNILSRGHLPKHNVVNLTCCNTGCRSFVSSIHRLNLCAGQCCGPFSWHCLQERRLIVLSLTIELCAPIQEIWCLASLKQTTKTALRTSTENCNGVECVLQKCCAQRQQRTPVVGWARGGKCGYCSLLPVAEIGPMLRVLVSVSLGYSRARVSTTLGGVGTAHSNMESGKQISTEEQEDAAYRAYRLE